LSPKTTSPPLPLRAIRALLRRLNIYLSRRYDSARAHLHPVPSPEAPAGLAAAEQALRTLDLPGLEARAYVEKHMPRLARTLTLVPPPRTSGRILELGCYMQITPFLKPFCGYQEVRGGYLGPLGGTEPKAVNVHGRRFAVTLDLFDVERDRFPYDDGYFETVLACELIEHMLLDPMHLLIECHRILEDGGRLLLTTPNVASLTSVARVLHGYDNPQIHYLYARPQPGLVPDITHVREYTAFELQGAVEAAGFEIETLITEPIGEFSMNLPMWHFLEEHGYNTSLRGEQTYCVAIKRPGLPVTRYPKFLYSE
jgi:SAM-dependent methyltransferase